MDAEQAAHVIQRLQQLEQVATEQALAGEHAERAPAEAQSKITQLTHTCQQGTRATGQVVDTRVLGKPDKWDGSEKGGANMELRGKAYAGAIDQQLYESGNQYDGS